MSEFRADVTVVGAGIAGLWEAKELIDQGLVVDVLEKDPELANGPTTKNEGWAHAGTYHSVAVYDEEDARRVTERTVYGYEAILGFAPESVEQDASVAIFAEEELIHTALRRWHDFDIAHQQMPKDRLADEGLDVSRIAAAFGVRDKSINPRVVVAKLADYILDNGGRIFTGANVVPIDGAAADVTIGGERHRFRADAFLVSAGVGTKQVFEDLMGTPFPMRYFKSHLAVVPRLTRDNIFYMDPLEAGLMSHGGATVVGINREAVEVAVPDFEVLPDKANLVHTALLRMMPEAGRMALATAVDVDCVKADIADDVFKRQSSDTTWVLQDLNIKVFEPVPGWVCAIPGKMTEAPALSRAAVGHVMGRQFRGVTDPSHASHVQARPSVTLRPLDRWIANAGK